MAFVVLVAPAPSVEPLILPLYCCLALRARSRIYTIRTFAKSYHFAKRYKLPTPQPKPTMARYERSERPNTSAPRAAAFRSLTRILRRAARPRLSPPRLIR